MFWRVKIQPCPSSTNRAAAVAHSGGQLAHLLGPAVPGHKDAGEAGAAVLTGAEITLLVQLQLSPEGGGAGDPPYGGEHPVQGELQGLSGGGLADPQTGEPALRLEQGLRCIAQQQADIVPGPYPLRQLWTAPELQPAVDQGHPAAHAGKEQGLLQGGVPAPHDGGVPALIEGAVTHGAVGHPLSGEGLLPLQAQRAVPGARGED